MIRNVCYVIKFDNVKLFVCGGGGGGGLSPIQYEPSSCKVKAVTKNKALLKMIWSKLRSML